MTKRPHLRMRWFSLPGSDLTATAFAKQSNNFTAITWYPSIAVDDIVTHKDAYMKLAPKQATGLASLTDKQNA